MLPRTAVNDASDYDSEIEKVKATLSEFQQKAHLVSSAEDVEKLEQNIRQMTDLLGSLLLGLKLQQSLDSARNLQKPHPNSIARSTQRDEHQGVTNLSNRLENLTFMASQFLPETG